MTPSYAVLLAVSLLAAAVVLRFMLWRALLVFRPASVRVEVEDPPGQVKIPAPLQPLASQLEALGFVPLGTHSERPPLGPLTTCFDFAHAASHTFATGFVSARGDPRVYLLSVLASGGFVITANYRRPARSIEGEYQSGGLERAALDRVFKAHVRLLEGHAVAGEPTLESRVDAARAWYSGPGRREVRQQNFPGLLWSVGTLGMVAAAVFARH